MLQGELHNRGSAGRCEACGEPFPCRTVDRLLVEQRKQQVSDRVRAPMWDRSEPLAPPDPNDELATRHERLVRALEEAGAPSYLIQRVRDGVYDHFRSTRVSPDGNNLTSHASKAELWDIARRALAGEFDAPENN